MQQWGGIPMQAWGHGAAMPPPPPYYYTGYMSLPFQGTIPDLGFVALYAHLPQPQESAAIVGAYARRNVQNVEPI